MLSIGEFAHATGVSRRMLRHWEDQGLIVPAEVDERTGHRRYARRQAGRVRAIAALRASGFGLDDIAGLLDSDLTESGLVALLRRREAELAAELAVTSARLAEVRSRLAAMTEGRHLMTALTLTPLPALHLLGATEDVTDETEIPDAAARLRTAAGAPANVDLVQCFDGSARTDRITVTVGTPAPAGTAATITIPGADHAATITLDAAPERIADAWIHLDAALAARSLRATGPYRHTIHVDGTVTLAAPVLPVD